MIADLVRQRRENSKELELELRLGVSEDGAFVAGVDAEAFSQLERDFEDTLRPLSSKWTEVIDYHYALTRSQRARTRVETDAERIRCVTTHIVKSALESRMVSRDDTSECCRVALSRESPLTTPPASCMPTHVRLKQIRRFVDEREGSVVWSYELSRTWSGNSRSVVEHLHNHSMPTYEVEVELVDADGSYLASRTDEEVAASIVAKANMLLGYDP